jgi:hypothetical protein
MRNNTGGIAWFPANQYAPQGGGRAPISIAAPLNLLGNVLQAGA